VWPLPQIWRYGESVALLITVPVFGQHDYTHALVRDLQREAAEYLIVDNRGDYPRIGDERVETPGENLGWAGGTDLGFRIAFSEGYSHAMTLNNDTRVSEGFLDGLLDSRLPADAGIVGPVIDHGFPCAEADEKVDAANYVPRPFYRAVPAVEGTALMLSRECWLTIGGLDLHTFAPYGWGIDLDLGVRAREAGYGVYITEMAYINHFGHKTANATFGRRRYEMKANFSKVRGMRRLHGRRWRKHVPPGTLPPPSWRKLVPSEIYTSIPLRGESVGQMMGDERGQSTIT
jgi:GT2 family glycosyltransferase